MKTKFSSPKQLWLNSTLGSAFINRAFLAQKYKNEFEKKNKRKRLVQQMKGFARPQTAHAS
jgi:hypothetical protein